MPLDFLLAIVRNEDEGRERRIDAAKAAAPYCHPRLNAIDHTGNLTINHEQAIADLE